MLPYINFLEVLFLACFFSLSFAAVAIPREINLCDGAGGGVCSTLANCLKNSGEAVSECPLASDSLAPMVCCQYKASCGDKVTQRVTMIESPGFPEYKDEDQSCSVNIMTGRDVCQVRLDFIQFELPGPDAVGICQPQNNMAIFAPRVPRGVFGGGRDSNKMCGINTGQHVYVPVDEFDDIQLLFTLKFSNTPVTTVASSSDTEYKWQIKATQIECGSTSQDMRELEAPEGCLQFYTDTTGRAKSINFDGTARIGPNLNYKMCFDLEDQDGVPCSVGLRAFTFGLPTGIDSPTNPFAVAGDGTDCSTGQSTVASTGGAPANTNGVAPNTPVLCCTQNLGSSLTTEEFGTGRFYFCGTNLGASVTQVVTTQAQPFTVGIFTGAWDISRATGATSPAGLAPITAADLGFDIQYTINTGVC